MPKTVVLLTWILTLYIWPLLALYHRQKRLDISGRLRMLWTHCSRESSLFISGLWWTFITGQRGWMEAEAAGCPGLLCWLTRILTVHIWPLVAHYLRLDRSGGCRMLWTHCSGKSSLLISDLFVPSHEKEAGRKRILKTVKRFFALHI